VRLAPDFGIVGYTDRWAYRPGEDVQLHLSVQEAGDVAIQLHRFCELIPVGPRLEIITERVEGIDLACRAEPQRTVIGSWFEAGLRDANLSTGFTLAFFALATTVQPEGNGLCWLDAGTGLSLIAHKDGVLSLQVHHKDEPCAIARLSGAFRPGEWSAVAISYDAETCQLNLATQTQGRVRTASCVAPRGFETRNATLILARTRRCPAEDPPMFNGKLESPALWNVPLPPEKTFARLSAFAETGVADGDQLIAAWDFSRRIDSVVAEDIGPFGLHGTLFNIPTRAVKGRQWGGNEQSFRHAPRDYAAIHFHQDDLADARWPVSARLCLPKDLKGGLYLIEVKGQFGCDTLPVIVRPLRSTTSLAFVASTFTWLAYANDRCLLHGNNPEMFANRLLVLTAGDCELAAHPEYGLSLYDTHLDGSGVCYAGRRRPCLTLRHTQRAWQGGLGGGLWNFSADLLVLSWLNRQGIGYDIVTDDDLDSEGDAALASYLCLVTGSHPEYHSVRSHDALTAFLARGGRLLYLGGNGFYWRIATHPDFPETIELRRAEDGNRSWASEPGEYYHSFDGAYGGLWRRNGRPPQSLVGVGYTGQGFYKSQPYRLRPEVTDPRVAFLFDNRAKPGTTLGNFGLSGGGAAGIEIDRADPSLGTPDHALVLATADRLDDSYILANEEVLVNRPNVVGDMSSLLRADLVFFETASGGAVLSTGSVAWAGSLGDLRPDNDVSQLTRRALRRFLDPEPFKMPGVS